MTKSHLQDGYRAPCSSIASPSASQPHLPVKLLIPQLEILSRGGKKRRQGKPYHVDETSTQTFDAVSLGIQQTSNQKTMPPQCDIWNNFGEMVAFLHMYETWEQGNHKGSRATQFELLIFLAFFQRLMPRSAAVINALPSTYDWPTTQMLSCLLLELIFLQNSYFV